MLSKSEFLFSADIRETEETFLDYLSLACSPETCYPKSRREWSPENPLLGHCAVVSEVARRYLGGQIVAASITTQDGLKYRHYWNRIDEKDRDFTISQFKSRIVNVSKVILKNRITDSETLKRVSIFEAKLLEILPHK